MKKVIESGTGGKKIVRRFTCPHCNCIYDDDEYYIASSSLNVGGLYADSVCPECGCRIELIVI